VTEIKDWNDLKKLPPSETHYINVVHTDTGEDAYGYDSYWISPFDRIVDEEHYLSTNVFYGWKITGQYNELLVKCGFDAKIIVEEE